MRKSLYLFFCIIFLSSCDHDYVADKRRGLKWFDSDDDSRQSEEER